MPVKVDAAIQEANVLHAKALKYQAQLEQFGVTTEELTSLITTRDQLIAKDTHQKNLMIEARQKTGAQNEAIKDVTKILRKVKNIAKIVFEDDALVRKEFHIGQTGIKTVKRAITELAYIKDVATRYQEQLAGRGLKPEDITQIGTISQSLVDIDTQQEMAKRNQVTATSEVKTTLKELIKRMKIIRRSAEVCFAENPDILHEFKRLE